ncbi:STN domain-containing protein, partial [Klebsiella pneumoniae]|uniref:STN domain-containing protein n=2 Tax=Pseudomonadota TaxID=1224 RepID=UPI00376ED738
MQVIAAPALIRGQRTRGASGRLTTSAALAMLLRGTGLRPVESNGVTILRRDQAQPVPITLGTRVPVVAAAAVQATTIARETPEATDDIVVNGYRSSLLAAQ